MNTNLDLQLWLAKQLPEAIVISDRGFFWSDHVPRSDEKVTINEWDYIVRCVEERLNEEQLLDYGIALVESAPTYFDNEIEVHWGKLAIIGLEQRATALKKVMGEGV